MTNRYQCLFFDLDHTLWDYETNSSETLREMFHLFSLQSRELVFADFQRTFSEVNRQLWDMYDNGKIDSQEIRQNRFVLILQKHGICDKQLARHLSDYYLSECPKKTGLMPGAQEVLQHFVQQYRLTVVTNGFDEVQRTKLVCSGLLPYFDHVVTSERAGYKKPAPEIFRFALQVNSISGRDAIMIGDNPLTDIAGANQAAIDSVWFNPEKQNYPCDSTFEINHLTELHHLL